VFLSFVPSFFLCMRLELSLLCRWRVHSSVGPPISVSPSVPPLTSVHLSIHPSVRPIHIQTVRPPRPRHPRHPHRPQWGDPTGRGDGGESIYGPAFREEIRPHLKHEGPGVLGMAASGPGTQGSQFYLTYRRVPRGSVSLSSVLQYPFVSLNRFLPLSLLQAQTHQITHPNTRKHARPRTLTSLPPLSPPLPQLLPRPRWDPHRLWPCRRRSLHPGASRATWRRYGGEARARGRHRQDGGPCGSFLGDGEG